MDIDSPAVQAYIQRTNPKLTPEFREQHPGVYKSMVALLYFAPDCPFEVKVAIQKPQTGDQLRQRTDRMISMETDNYINDPKNMSIETQERLKWQQANKSTN